MTDEEFLSIQPEATREELRAINAEYLGSYFYGITHPEENGRYTKFDPDRSRMLSMRLFNTCVELLYKRELIDEVEFLELSELPNSSFTPETKEEAKEKVREMLKTTKPDWMGEV